MNIFNILQYAFFLGIILILVKPLGQYMQHVFDGEHTFPDRMLRPVERWLYRLAGVDPDQEMDWKEYAIAFTVFGFLGTLFLYFILRIQPVFHTFDPAFQPAALAPDLAMNTAIRFSTTTTWQAYGGETTMSYFSQMIGLAALALALAGMFAKQVRRPASSGTLPTDTPLFATLMVATAIIVGALSYFPALALGAIVEHLQL